MMKTRLKFFVSKETGELISLISKNLVTGQLRGVSPDTHYQTKICVISPEIKNQIQPNVLYEVTLHEMKGGNGYVAIHAEPIKFLATIEMCMIPKCIYKIMIRFGKKTIYYDPMDGRTKSSKTSEGVVRALEERNDISNKIEIIENFRKAANVMKQRMLNDGYYAK